MPDTPSTPGRAALLSDEVRLALDILASELDVRPPSAPPPADSDSDLDSDARFVPPTATPRTPDDARVSD